MKTIEILGKFKHLGVARRFSAKTTKASVIVMGDDMYFWVVPLKVMEGLLKAGYELAE